MPWNSSARAVTRTSTPFRASWPVAIDEAGERIGSRSTRLLRGEGSAGELRAPLAELGGLLDLYELLEP